MYDYYAKFCRCQSVKYLQYDELVNDMFTGRPFNMHTFGVCPVNNIASLLARHLATRLQPDSSLVSRFSQMSTELIKDLSTKVKYYDLTSPYSVAEHCTHYTGAKLNGLITGLANAWACKKLVKKMGCFTKTGEW